MRLWIRGGQLLTPDQTLEDSVLVIEAGRVTAIEPVQQVAGSPADTRVISAAGLMVAPGLIDVHVHGSAGSDTMDATPEALITMAGFFVKHGVTAFLATTISQSPQAVWAAVENAARNSAGLEGAQPLGIHLEGPYLNPAHRGAQPEQWVRNPDPVEYTRWFETGIVRLVTVAPEIPGALECIRAGVRSGIRFSAGHTDASFDQVRQAADEGLSQSTHTFNGMRGLHHREPGTVGAVLGDDRIFCEVIADGVHVHPAVVGLMVRAKGVERTLLVTDAIRAAGLADGKYDLGKQMVTVREGVARTESGGLAGSTLTLNRAVFNAMRFTGLTINQALRMATTTPAAALGLSSRKGALRPGMDADAILFDASLNIQAAVVQGNLVYQSPSFQQRM